MVDKIEMMKKHIGKTGLVYGAACYREDEYYENINELYFDAKILDVKYSEKHELYVAKVIPLRGHGIGWIDASTIDLLKGIVNEC
ncbi:hypothetical protein AB2T63_15105 [Clostridium butyricum]|uniref:Uncharacterized protein n=3 Tax=root TaxID=1 RepID=A0A0A6PXT6_CLOBU|nr:MULTISPECIES: hypothetical protein [Clostridium]KHD13971.1 hypothetical protein OA81_17695 [Clostridium butyricum]KHD15202.1 hypothetical protein OA81_10635 [Clostridium butyricum]MDU1114849.1 hypothetical protein [Clostridium sp.]MDU7712391.1 hypothetical protein [Clostridium butyricum]PPV15562.1 hypothetical protein AWN73_11610 [Clostridium butyricum]